MAEPHGQERPGQATLAVRAGQELLPPNAFDHPNLPEDHLLRRHVLYRLRRSEWPRGRQDG